MERGVAAILVVLFIVLAHSIWSMLTSPTCLPPLTLLAVLGAGAGVSALFYLENPRSSVYGLALTASLLLYILAIYLIMSNPTYARC